MTSKSSPAKRIAAPERNRRCDVKAPCHQVRIEIVGPKPKRGKRLPDVRIVRHDHRAP
jgi:hypothetical protein